MSIQVKGKVALVTGSNRGIGRAFVEGLIEKGASKVYVTARNVDGLKDLVEKFGEKVKPLTLDVTDESQVKAAAQAAGDVEILVNNAGVAAQMDLFADSLDDARREFEVNYFGSLYTTRAFASILKSNGGGAIINVSSIAGLSNFPALATYSDSKAAVHSLTVYSRLTLAQQGTTVLGVYPGPVDTDMAKGLEMDKATPESVVDKVLNGLESGETAVFPDAFSENYRAGYEGGSKVLEAFVENIISQPA